MPNLTPQAIVEEMYISDQELELLAKQYAWFKGQKDHWKDKWDFAVAKGTIEFTGPATKSKAGGLLWASQQLVEIPWLDGAVVYLPDMVRLTESSFDLIAKAYNRMETHIGILQSVNKNVMQDYGRASQLEYT